MVLCCVFDTAVPAVASQLDDTKNGSTNAHILHLQDRLTVDRLTIRREPFPHREESFRTVY
ncbi:MAG: hypothetical protein PCALPYG08_4569 [uncultured Paraburkholderia sp.]|nr:MAG: hypothetical protein PCALPYG08_4569 [uncultured Paraburkholderia sp.]